MRIAFFAKILLCLQLIALQWGCAESPSGGRIAERKYSIRQIQNIGQSFFPAESNHCEQSGLSAQFDLSYEFRRSVKLKGGEQKCIINLFIKEKNASGFADSVSVASSGLYATMFMNCERVVSFSTGRRLGSPVMDNYFGDVCVTDFNFDGLDDLAIARESMSNAGPTYSYFIQGDQLQFAKDVFLTDSMQFFPHKIDRQFLMLTTYVHANAGQESENIFRLNSKTKRWECISRKWVAYK